MLNLDPNCDISSAVMAAELDPHFWFCICLLIPDPNPFTWTGKQAKEGTNCTIYTRKSDRLVDMYLNRSISLIKQIYINQFILR